MALLFKNSIKICSFLFTLLFIIAHSLSSPLPTLPDVSYSSEFPTLAGTYGSGNDGVGMPLGWWELLQRSIGISAMHMQLLYNDKIVIFDRTDFGQSNLSLPAGRQCIRREQDSVGDCTAHSVLYDVVSNTFRPLTVLTDTFCSSGSVDPSGNLIQTGGYNSGEKVIRTFNPCFPATADTCDWAELGAYLAARRWYASNAILPDGRIIVVGGRGSFSYEFFPKNNQKRSDETAFLLRFLAETWDGRNRENNLYPFLHLLPNGNLFIFANNRSIEFDYISGKVVREFPIMPSPEKRNYPSTGSSVILPIILNGSAATPELEVLICGGASPESFDLAATKGVYVAASRTCGRMKITAPQPQWIMEEMPMPRVMPDMVILPTGDVLIINGATNGTAGWENADNPVLNPVLYRTSETDPTRKFVVLNPTKVPRMYHSCAVLVADGRVIVGGSNPHPNYNFSREAKYPTELSMEAFYPPYLDPVYAELRPSILAVETENKVVTYGQVLSVTFAMGSEAAEAAVTMVMPPFATHSFGMNQRLVVLGDPRVERLSVYGYKVTVTAPPNEKVAPPGYYMLFVVHAGVPSHGIWVQLRRSLF